MEIERWYRITSMLNDEDGVKLICLGLIPGKEIQIIRRAPLFGAFLIECDNKRIAISSHELNQLNLELVR